MPPRQKSEKTAQQLSAELALLEDKNYARLKNQLDEFEKSMGLAMIQINSRSQAALSPNGPSLADLNDKLTQLQENAVAVGTNPNNLYFCVD
ncbi:hypothetical protein PCANC_27839 [Puccinia coronata f. sp. avenae]|uniref:Uncharacterized protein n=1 Tax=Puccinia coronata f. sp. avenae TaxID=200324 RepID=A0A2N5S289_9BASI|nr:hypothetical protein PCANC_27839 [Puccinia coronata f. sp. avenae]